MFIGIKHIKCVDLISTCQPGDGRPSVDCFGVKIICYGVLGDPVPGFTNRIVKLRDLSVQFSRYINSNIKFIFSDLEKECVGERYYSLRRYHCLSLT